MIRLDKSTGRKKKIELKERICHSKEQVFFIILHAVEINSSNEKSFRLFWDIISASNKKG